jgi:D-3-phosphoglycerate dehydrogenase
MMPRPKVLCTLDLKLAPEALVPLRCVATVDHFRPARLDRVISRYDAYLGNADIPVDAAVLAHADRLKVIATPSTGTDHIDLRAAKKRGITLLSLTTEYALLDTFTATAEHAWGLLLACLRQLPAAAAATCRGKWARERFTGRQLSGKTLGVIGVGRLGRMLIAYGTAFRMRVLGCDPKPFRIASVRRVTLDTLLRASDVISIHVHLTEATRGLIGRREFAKMKMGAVIVNTSRGAILDERALLAALRSGRVGAAGLDVIDGEWLPDVRRHPLVRYARSHDNLVITPHIGGATVESIAGARMFMANKLAEYLRQNLQ